MHKKSHLENFGARKNRPRKIEISIFSALVGFVTKLLNNLFNERLKNNLTIDISVLIFNDSGANALGDKHWTSLLFCKCE